jgi:Holliday junction resolvasome RuvABC ATP-dependent DNA helicase subunit
MSDQKTVDYNELANKISYDIVAKWFEERHIDQNGLGEREYNFLKYLKRSGATSAPTLKNGLGISNEQDFSEIDEYLRRLGLVTLTPGGRNLTKEGKNYIENHVDLRDRISRQTS